MNQTRIKKRKSFKKFFVFLFFIRVWFMTPEGCSRNQGFYDPSRSSRTPEWFMNQTWTKKRHRRFAPWCCATRRVAQQSKRKKKFFSIFLFFCFSIRVWFMTPEGVRGVRGSWLRGPRELLNGSWMSDCTITGKSQS
jgi:hypothetical protein